MIDYITVISSPVHDTLILNYDANQLDQLDVVNTLHQNPNPWLTQKKNSYRFFRVHINSTSQSIQQLSSRQPFVTITHDKKPTTPTETWQLKSQALRRVASKYAENKHPSNGTVMEKTPQTDHQPSRCRKSIPSTATSPSEPNSPIDRQMSLGGNSPSPRQASSDDALPHNQRRAMHLKAFSMDSTPFVSSSSGVLGPSIRILEEERKDC